MRRKKLGHIFNKNFQSIPHFKFKQKLKNKAEKVIYLTTEEKYKKYTEDTPEKIQEAVIDTSILDYLLGFFD